MLWLNIILYAKINGIDAKLVLMLTHLTANL